MHPSAYLRHPTLHGDLIVFVTDDDLWSASVSPEQSVIARRLTAGLSEPGTPCLSPDGQWIAFVGRDEQHPEVCVMPSAGGPVRRLTWLGPDVLVRGWTAAGDIVFVTTHGQPFFRNHRAHTISPTGGLPQRLPWGQVNHLAVAPNGAVVIGRNTADPARWKRYRGGTAGHFWIDADGSGSFRRMSELKGNLTCPMWLGGRLYHLSDSEGVGNLYSCLPDGSDLRRHSDHDDFYARNAQSDGQRIVYQCGAELWLFDPADPTGAAPQRLVIDTPSHRTQAARKFVAAVDHLDDLHVHPAGHSLAADVRGKLFSFALWEGAVRQHGDAAARHRHGQWLADGTTLVATSDASGEECIVVFENGAERAMPWELGRITSLRATPRGTQLAIANHRNEVWLGDVASGALVKVDHSGFGRTDDLAWSADGAWLAYSYQADPRHVAIKLHEVAAGVSTLVTQPEFRDYSPAFDPDGKYLYFLSYRTFDPVYDSVQFDLSFPRASRPFLIALQAGGRPPFDPVPKGFKGEDGDPAAKEKEKGKEKDKPAALHIDLDGIALRVAPFPVREDRFAKIAGAAGGKVLWTVQPMVGAHGRGGHKEESGKLDVFDFATARTETLMAKADGFTVAADHATVVVREGKRVRALGVKRRAEPEHAAVPDTPSRKTGWVDLARIRVSVEPRLEWRQMLREVWRLQRDQFWLASMSGLDWDAVYARYAPLLDRVSTRAELSDLIWEMQGELGTSHAYEMGGDHRRPPQIALGCLAADLHFVEPDQSYEITRIVRGDTWEASADSPLNAVGVEARLGERIVAVNGQRVSRELPPQALLVSQAGAKVELTLASGESDVAVRNVVVTLLADEVPARYREWVESNRAWVHAQSGGRVGYFHLPDMMAAGFAEFHRYFSTECDRDGLIVDLRYNRGGHVSPLLLEKIARKRIGYNVKRWGVPSSYPDEAVAGPVVALTNEHAGSDGDIFSHGFKLMGLGPLVGMRTWGGVIGIWPRHKLVDGTETTQPEFSFWFKDVGWGVENHGTDPDIEIDNAPQDTVAGHDRQLETALATVQRLIGEATSGLPEFGPTPDLKRQPLPPRR